MFHESFQQHYAELKTLVDAALKETVDALPWPSALKNAVEYSLMAGGKRLRPVLVLLATEVCGGNPTEAVPAACAIEMIHTYSLIHDDLPSMDDDDLRRGRPTSHVVFGEALAILAGDALLTLAFETLGEAKTSALVTAECLKTLASAAGGQGMVGGQILDLEAERGDFIAANSATSAQTEANSGSQSTAPTVSSSKQNAELPDPASDKPLIRVEQLIQIHRMKTGALITAALELGAIVANASVDQKEALKQYGQCTGLAFQIADDLLDVTGSDIRLGKETGRDNELGKLTYPSLIGIEASRQKAESLVETACRALEVFSENTAALKQLAQFIVERDH
ncbi:MAG: polyprenyl synthetase family protein [Fuerstiella sp.]